MRDGKPKTDRNKFITANIHLFQKIDGTNYKHTDWKSEPGRSIVEKARKQLGYSCTTASCDIFWNLMKLHESMQEKK